MPTIIPSLVGFLTTYGTAITAGTALVGTAATIYNMVQANKQKQGSTILTAPSPVVADTPAAEVAAAQRTAEDKTRRRALAATALNSTILTSPTGITSGERTILGG